MYIHIYIYILLCKTVSVGICWAFRLCFVQDIAFRLDLSGSQQGCSRPFNKSGEGEGLSCLFQSESNMNPP